MDASINTVPYLYELRAKSLFRRPAPKELKVWCESGSGHESPGGLWLSGSTPVSVSEPYSQPGLIGDRVY